MCIYAHRHSNHLALIARAGQQVVAGLEGVDG